MNSIAVIIGSLSLAQTSDGPYAPPPLPAPPRLAYWLFENPWPPAIALAAAAVLFFFILNTRSQTKRGGMIAAGLLAAAAVLIITSFAITTEREILIDRTRELVRTTAAASIRELGPMLASDVGLNVLGRAFRENKDGILGLVDQHMAGQYRVDSQSTSSISASVDRQGIGKTLVRVRVEVQGIPNRSWWRITWRKSDAGEWQVMYIEGLQIDMVQASQIAQ